MSAVKTVTRLVARLKLLEKAFSKDGVPALLIEQALPEIEAQANEILDRLIGREHVGALSTPRRISKTRTAKIRKRPWIS